MTQERHVMVPSVYVVMMNEDEKVLAVLRKNTGYMDGYWGLPAGHVEKDELPIKGVIREAKEEIGVEINPEDLNFVHLMIREAHDITGERVDIFFESNNWSGEPQNMEPDKHGGMDWIDPHSDSTPMVPYEREAINYIAEGIKYSEWKEE